MGILVSINCITYNQEDYIADAIEGFLMQNTNFTYEILIGEDCSTDGTKEIVEQYVNKYPNKIRLITSKQNVGMGENGLRVFEQSKGKYIAVCEGDDYWTDPYKLQKQVDYMENNPECTLCFHNALIISANIKTIIKKEKPMITRTNSYYRGGNSNYNAGELALLGFVPTASFLYPRHLMKNAPEWYHAAIVGDTPLKLITTNHGYAHYIDENMSVYRVGVKDSVTDKWRKENVNQENQVLLNKRFIDLYDDFNNYSNYKYDSEIRKVKIPFELIVLGLGGERKKIKSSKFEEYIKRLSAKEKVRFYAKIYFPKSFAVLSRIKASI